MASAFGCTTFSRANASSPRRRMTLAPLLASCQAIQHLDFPTHWNDDTHKARVRDLATQLRGNGVDVRLEHWHTVLGDQLPEFMESEIRDNDHVIIACRSQGGSSRPAQSGPRLPVPAVSREPGVGEQQASMHSPRAKRLERHQ